MTLPKYLDSQAKVWRMEDEGIIYSSSLSFFYFLFFLGPAFFPLLDKLLFFLGPAFFDQTKPMPSNFALSSDDLSALYCKNACPHLYRVLDIFS